MIGGFFIAGHINNGNVDRTYNMGDVIGCYVPLSVGVIYLGASAMNIQTLKRGLDWAGKILAVIDRKPSIDIYNQDAESIDRISDIELDNVSFKYEGRNKVVLDGVSLCFKNGKTTALVGPSGCGKSSIIRLIERFYDPSEGQVLVNSKDLKSIQLQQYRRKIGYVGQEPCLLNETIRENLLNGNPGATDYEIEEALKHAQAYDFVQKLPKGINTDVGGVGSKLSGGQKQRIAIARALLKKPDILILDEATSALDSENERAVQAAIDNIGRTQSITTIVIAHRLTTIQNADFIYVLNEGKVVEMGKHEMLIKENGLYHSYFKSQEVANSVCIGKLHKEKQEDQADSKTEEELLANIEDQNVNVVEQPNIFKTFMRLLPYNRPKVFITVLFIGWTVAAVGLPISTIYILKWLFSYNGHDSDYIKSKMAIYCPIIFGIGWVVFIASAINRCTLQILSLTMTNLVRNDLYKALISQPIQFYDKKENSTGQLTGILSVDSRVITAISVHVFNIKL